MNPDLPMVSPDPAFHTIVTKLMTFHGTQPPVDETGLALKREADIVAIEILEEALAMVERFAQQRSSLAKYDLLKWVGNKKQEVRLYK